MEMRSRNMKRENIEKPSVTLIVPVYNGESSICACMDSIVNQTLKKIEIICVEDNSEDASAEILRGYAQRDERIRIVFHETNLGISQSRKDGVAYSSGKYIMFVNQDGQLCQDACQSALDAIEEYKTDIVQFDTDVINCAGEATETILTRKKMLQPCLDKIQTENLISSLWQDGKIGPDLWNKIYDGIICRKAFAEMEDIFVTVEPDWYALFLLTYYAKSYIGIEKKLYKCMFDGDSTDNKYISMSAFDAVMKEKDVWKCLVRFVENRHEKEKYQQILDDVYQCILSDCVNKWANNLLAEDVSEGFEHLINVWGMENVIPKLVDENWKDSVYIAEKMTEVERFKTSRKQNDRIQTIAIYYRCVRNGGAQRVVAILANEWSKMRDENGKPLYRVILVTDEETEEQKAIPEYDLEQEVIRAYVPVFEKDHKVDYKARYCGWRDIVTKYNVDLVVTGMWTAPSTLWDMLSVKGQPSKPGFVIHAHNFTCVPMQLISDKFAELMFDYQICDGVVTLSDVDKRYVSCFNSHVEYICNPVSFSLKDIPVTRRENYNLLWVGRISKEKQPLDVIYAMSFIVRECPNVCLHIVGSGDLKLTEEMENLIKQLNLQKHVFMEGFTLGVEKYYQNAQLMLVTSEYEGFSLVFCEALSYGVPVITYDMPWLTFVRDGRGCISVKQKRPDLMAKVAIDFMRNPEKAEAIGLEGRKQIEEMASIDIGMEWKKFFESLYEEKEIDEDTEENIIYRYMTAYAFKGKREKVYSLNKTINSLHRGKDWFEQQWGYQKAEAERLREQKNKLAEQNSRLEKQNKYLIEQKNREVKEAQNKIRNTVTFKAGKAVLYFPRRIRKILKKLLK